MAIFGNGKTTVAKATFAERLSSVKASFRLHIIRHLH